MIYDIGLHRVRHGDILDGVTDLMGGDQADIMYLDAPWNNFKYWQTLNIKMNPGAVRKEVTADAFLTTAFAIAVKYAKNIVFVEYGVKWREEIYGYGINAGLLYVGRASPYYTSKNLPLDLHIFSKRVVTLPHGYLDKIEGTKGLATVIAATFDFKVPGGIVLDPCCGLGYSAKMAVNYGMCFRGNELNGKRLMKTRDFLESTV